MTADAVRGLVRRENRYSAAQVRVLRALAAAETPCTAMDLTERGLMGPTVLTLGCLMRRQLVSSQVVRRADVERPIPVYVLTGKGRDVIARLIAGDAVAGRTPATGQTAPIAGA